MTENTELTSVASDADPTTPVTVEQLEAALGKGTTDTSKPALEPAEPNRGDAQDDAEKPADEPKAEDEPTDGEDAKDGDKPGHKRLTQRFGELTWRAKEAERKAAELAAELEKVKASAPASVEEPPKPEAYPLGEFDPKYMLDVAKHAARQEFAAERRRIEDDAMAREVARAREAFEAKITPKDEGAIIFLSDPDIRRTEVMAEVVLTSDHGVRLADHLGRNPDLCAKIAKLSPVRQALELGRLEARLTAPPPVSKAPPPVPTVGTRAQTQKRPEDMTQREFNEWWDAKEAAKRKSA